MQYQNPKKESRRIKPRKDLQDLINRKILQIRLIFPTTVLAST